jgi:hypothetical protein
MQEQANHSRGEELRAKLKASDSLLDEYSRKRGGGEQRCKGLMSSFLNLQLKK